MSTRSWSRLPSGPSGRFDSAIALYQSTVLIAGGTPELGDVWGYHTEIGQWLLWTKTLPRQIGGTAFIKNEVLYTFNEHSGSSNFIFIHGFDLVERKSQSFGHQVPVSV